MTVTLGTRLTPRYGPSVLLRMVPPYKLSSLGTLKNEHGHARLEESEVAQQRPRLLVTEWQERGSQRLTDSSADTRPGTDTSDVGNPTE
jgi:hypothetical protein